MRDVVHINEYAGSNQQPQLSQVPQNPLCRTESAQITPRSCKESIKILSWMVGWDVGFSIRNFLVPRRHVRIRLRKSGLPTTKLITLRRAFSLVRNCVLFTWLTIGSVKWAKWPNFQTFQNSRNSSWLVSSKLWRVIGSKVPIEGC